MENIVASPGVQNQLLNTRDMAGMKSYKEPAF